MREAAEMASPTSDYFAAPLEDNLFEWHFTVRGPEDTDFQVRKAKMIADLLLSTSREEYTMEELLFLQSIL